MESVKPFAANIPSILAPLDAVLQFNLSSEAKNDVHALKKYVNSFTCVLLAAIWFKILSAIDIRNKVLQARNATLDVEVRNVESLIDDLKYLRDQWSNILSEAKIVVSQLGIAADLPSTKRTCFYDELRSEEIHDRNEETVFRQDVFNVLLDSVILGLTTRYSAANEIISFLWQYRDMSNELIEEKAEQFIQKYSVDVSDHLLQEIKELKTIHDAELKRCLHLISLIISSSISFSKCLHSVTNFLYNHSHGS